VFFRQILQTDLGCASYLIADGGEAAVVDPRWDIEPYLAAAAPEGAAALFDTLHRLERLGEQVEVWPAHVGGSLCGSGSVTDRTSSTIGDELRENPLLGIAARDEFVRELTAASPARPPRVARIVELNMNGPPEPPSPRRSAPRT
jgi:hydroxyacylglutathione hydrolase